MYEITSLPAIYNYMKFTRIIPAIIFLSAVLVTGSTGSTGSGVSPSPNHTENPQLRLVAPNGGEVLFRGEPMMIRWTSAGMPESAQVVLVLYFRGIKIRVISKRCPDNGQFTWLVPAEIPPRTNYRVRIRWIRRPEINDFSDADFQIRDNR